MLAWEMCGETLPRQAIHILAGPAALWETMFGGSSLPTYGSPISV